MPYFLIHKEKSKDVFTIIIQKVNDIAFLFSITNTHFQIKGRKN